MNYLGGWKAIKVLRSTRKIIKGHERTWVAQSVERMEKIVAEKQLPVSPSCNEIAIL